MNKQIGNDLCTEIITQAIDEMKVIQGDSFSLDEYSALGIPVSCRGLPVSRARNIQTYNEPPIERSITSRMPLTGAGAVSRDTTLAAPYFQIGQAALDTATRKDPQLRQQHTCCWVPYGEGKFIIIEG